MCVCFFLDDFEGTVHPKILMKLIFNSQLIVLMLYAYFSTQNTEEYFEECW